MMPSLVSDTRGCRWGDHH